jgi:hypothetical protein
MHLGKETVSKNRSSLAIWHHGLAADREEVMLEVPNLLKSPNF